MRRSLLPGRWSLGLSPNRCRLYHAALTVRYGVLLLERQENAESQKEEESQKVEEVVEEIKREEEEDIYDVPSFLRNR